MLLLIARFLSRLVNTWYSSLWCCQYECLPHVTQSLVAIWCRRHPSSKSNTYAFVKDGRKFLLAPSSSKPQLLARSPEVDSIPKPHTQPLPVPSPITRPSPSPNTNTNQSMIICTLSTCIRIRACSFGRCDPTNGASVDGWTTCIAGTTVDATDECWAIISVAIAIGVPSIAEEIDILQRIGNDWSIIGIATAIGTICITCNIEVGIDRK